MIQKSHIKSALLALFAASSLLGCGDEAMDVDQASALISNNGGAGAEESGEPATPFDCSALDDETCLAHEACQLVDDLYLDDETGEIVHIPFCTSADEIWGEPMPPSVAPDAFCHDLYIEECEFFEECMVATELFPDEETGELYEVDSCVPSGADLGGTPMPGSFCDEIPVEACEHYGECALLIDGDDSPSGRVVAAVRCGPADAVGTPAPAPSEHYSFCYEVPLEECTHYGDCALWTDGYEDASGELIEVDYCGPADMLGEPAPEPADAYCYLLEEDACIGDPLCALTEDEGCVPMGVLDPGTPWPAERCFDLDVDACAAFEQCTVWVDEGGEDAYCGPIE